MKGSFKIARNGLGKVIGHTLFRMTEGSSRRKSKWPIVTHPTLQRSRLSPLNCTPSIIQSVLQLANMISWEPTKTWDTIKNRMLRSKQLTANIPTWINLGSHFSKNQWYHQNWILSLRISLRKGRRDNQPKVDISSTNLLKPQVWCHPLKRTESHLEAVLGLHKQELRVWIFNMVIHT